MNSPSADTAPVRAGEELDWNSLSTWLFQNVSGLDGEMKVSQFHGGHANLTYCVSFEDRALVIRRQPFGEIAPGAHDMKREYRALSGLNPVFDRAPRVFALCEDESVIGAPFLVMERRAGVVVRAEIPPELEAHANVEERISLALVDAMAEFHAIDPVAAGLEKLGRPEGFVERQLKGWYQRWQLVTDTPDKVFEEVHQSLLSSKPQTLRNTLVHNDLKLDNCMFDPANPDRVATILDWDMTTIGDPLIELGTLLSYWREPGDATNRAPTIELNMSGFPPRSALVERYARSGMDVSNVDWYEAFGLWKQAVVLKQLFHRYATGESQDQRMAAFPDFIPGQLEVALEILS
jgi:aminoglycoside phosphotransferase (APT) family kinase protein